jgi:hypothetical protein
MVEPGAPDRCDRVAVELTREIDAADFSSERAGNRADPKGIGNNSNSIAFFLWPAHRRQWESRPRPKRAEGR